MSRNNAGKRSSHENIARICRRVACCRYHTFQCFQNNPDKKRDHRILCNLQRAYRNWHSAEGARDTADNKWIHQGIGQPRPISNDDRANIF